MSCLLPPSLDYFPALATLAFFGYPSEDKPHVSIPLESQSASQVPVPLEIAVLSGDHWEGVRTLGSGRGHIQP